MLPCIIPRPFACSLKHGRSRCYHPLLKGRKHSVVDNTNSRGSGLRTLKRACVAGYLLERMEGNS